MDVVVGDIAADGLGTGLGTAGAVGGIVVAQRVGS